MRSPRLTDLPPPPPGKTGWPWTSGGVPLPDTTGDGRPWPRFSIVTPSYNQGAFVEETIRSVLLQGYPNLEYIVIDGGSTDESIDILRKYERWLAYWVTERDGGQSEAINKGFAQATGEVFGWLNSDDVYEPDALQLVARYLVSHPECRLLYGDGWYVAEDGSKTHRCEWVRPYDRKLFASLNFILQPAAFWYQSVWEVVGPLRTDYHYAMDWEWLLRASRAVVPQYMPVDLARWRMTDAIKTHSGGRARRKEIAAISRHYGGIWQPTYIAYQLDRTYWWLSDRLGDTTLAPLAPAIRALTRPIRWILYEHLWRGRYLW